MDDPKETETDDPKEATVNDPKKIEMGDPSQLPRSLDKINQEVDGGIRGQQWLWRSTLYQHRAAMFFSPLSGGGAALGAVSSRLEPWFVALLSAVPTVLILLDQTFAIGKLAAYHEMKLRRLKKLRLKIDASRISLTDADDELLAIEDLTP